MNINGDFSAIDGYDRTPCSASPSHSRASSIYESIDSASQTESEAGSHWTADQLDTTTPSTQPFSDLSELSSLLTTSPRYIVRQGPMRSIVATGAMFASFGVGWGSWNARLPGFKEALGASDQTMGLVLMGNAAGNLLVLPAAAPLARTLGRKPFALAAGIGFAAMMGVAPKPSQPAVAGVAQVGLGVFSALVNVAMNAEAVSLEARTQRRLLGSYHGLFSLGALAGSGLGAALANREVDLQTQMFGVAIGLAAVGIMAACNTLGGTEPPAAGGLAINRTLLVLGLLAMLSSLGEGALGDWTGIYLREGLHTDLTTAAAGAAVVQGAMVAGRFLSDFWDEEISPAHVMAVGGTCTAVGLSVGLGSNSVPAMFGGVALGALGLSNLGPVITHTAGKRFPELGATAVALISGFNHAGFLTGPPLIGFVAERVGLRLALATVAVAGIFKVALSPMLAQSMRDRRVSMRIED